MAMKKWTEESSDFLDALGGNSVNPLDQKKPVARTPKKEPATATALVSEKEEDTSKKKITTIHIEEETYKAFKKFSVEKEQSITDLLKAAMLDMLEGNYYPKRLK